MQKTDVLIIGAGPVGLFMANELARHGLSVKIIDQKAQLSTHSKALGIHVRSMQMLRDAGFYDQILQQAHKATGMQLKANGKLITQINFEKMNSPLKFVTMLPQSLTEKILYQGLEQKKIAVEWQTQLLKLQAKDDHVEVVLQKQSQTVTEKASWLIACDGAHSTVRHQLNFEFKGAAYPQQWWLADLQIDWSLSQDDLIIFLHRAGLQACFPMGNKRYRIVLEAPKNGPKDPTLDDIVRVFKERTQEQFEFADPHWLTGFTLHHRQVQQYRAGRIFLCGDAAHIHSPMGGQGLNTGMQDAYNLAWKLSLVEKGYATENLLDSYHQERFPVGQKVLRETDHMTKLFTLTNPLVIKLRNWLIGFMTSFQFVKAKMFANLAELTINYRDSAIVKQDSTEKAIAAGDNLPNVMLQDLKTNQVVSMYQLTGQTKHHLFYLVGRNEKFDQTFYDYLQQQLKAYAPLIDFSVIFYEQQQLPEQAVVNHYFLDQHKQAHHDFCAKYRTLVFVRPDQYIGYYAMPADAELFLEFLKGYIVGCF